MLTATGDGALQLRAPCCKKAHYDMANRTLLMQADGCGAISRFSVAGKYQVLVPDSFYAAWSLNGAPFSPLADKTVTMHGHLQTVQSMDSGVELECETFLPDGESDVCQRYTLRNRTQRPVVFSLMFGMLLQMGEIAASDGSAAYEAVHTVPRADGFVNFAGPTGGLTILCGAELTLREVQDVGVHYGCEAVVPPMAAREVPLLYTMRENAALADVGKAYAQARAYSAWLSGLAAGTPEQRAQFISCLNCGVSSFKTVGEFQGFFAGVHYAVPARTYYRDSYFTAVAVLPYQPQLVRAQLLTLASGIGDNGRCPSAVCADGAQFWPNHVDAPLFFVILLADYVDATGDSGLLSEVVHGKAMREWAELIARASMAQADENGLLCRIPGHRHDWADNVFREGYVTYIEALYCKMLRCSAKLLPENAAYAAALEKAQDGIERLLWLPDSGWYADYRSDTFLERHLAIDTVLLAWFDLVPPARAKSMLTQMERWLESRSNTRQPFGTWGTLCCWPPYRNKAHLVEKSSYDYVYHNGSDWPYWSCVYALAKTKYGLSAAEAGTRWFLTGLAQEFCTPVEYYNPITGRGSMLQGWSAMGAPAVAAIIKQEE